MVYIKTALGFIIKLFTFKKGSLFLLSGFSSFGLSYYVGVLFKDVETRDVLVTMVIEISLLLMFMLFTTTDLITGLQTAFYLNSVSKSPIPKELVVKSSKLWRTFWKGFGVVMFTGMLTLFAIIALLLKSEYVYWAAIWSLLTFWLMACGFEFYSIGENLAKRGGGKKPPIFGFVDKILDAVQRKAISKIDKSFDILDSVKNAYEDPDSKEDNLNNTINTKEND